MFRVPETNFDFMRIHKLMFFISVVAVVATCFLFYKPGLNFGTDFAGGILMEVQTEKAADMPTLRQELSSLDLGSISVQEFGDYNHIMLRIGQQEGGEDAQKQAVERIKQTIGEDANYQRVEYVGPQVGKELIAKGVWAVVLSTIGVLIYLLFRFQWQFATASLIALLHDVLLTLGLFAVTRAEFDLSTLAAVLMIAGYSINDTVVVFDRVREYANLFKTERFDRVLNRSINSTLSRTILTSGTTLLTVFVLFLFGGEVLRGFALALLVGIGVGTYSSIFVASPLVMWLGVSREQFIKPKKEKEEAVV